MWNFSIGRTLGIVVQTKPFIVFRMAVYFSIALIYLVAFGLGSGAGYVLGVFIGLPLVGQIIGGAIALGAITYGVNWARDYLFHMVKAPHVLALSRVLYGDDIAPANEEPVGYAQTVIRQRYGDPVALRGTTRTVMAVLRLVVRVMADAGQLPLALKKLSRIGRLVARVSIIRAHEVILAYDLHTLGDEPARGCRDGLVYYAQNIRHVTQNALWIALLRWSAAAIFYVLIVGPVTAICYMLPGAGVGFGLIFAAILTWAFKVSVLEPFSVTAQMEIYFLAIEGQAPNPRWQQHLAKASPEFRSLFEVPNDPAEPHRQAG